MAESADAVDLKSAEGQPSCGFESRPGHQCSARGSIFCRTSVGPRSDPATGKQRRHYKQGFRTKREAEAALDELLSVIRSGDVVN